MGVVGMAEKGSKKAGGGVEEREFFVSLTYQTSPCVFTNNSSRGREGGGGGKGAHLLGTTEGTIGMN